MSRRAALVAGSTACLVVLVVGALAVIGSVPAATAGSDAWSGWTGRLDSTSVSDRAAMTPDDAVAVALLARASRAASTVPYSGRAETWTRWGSSVTTITHVPGTGTIALADGVPASQARLAPDGQSDSFADEGRQLAVLRDNYRVLRQADLDTTVAGRAADAVVAIDAEGVLDARFWLDHSTGLLLRKELLDSAGKVRSEAGFQTFSLGVPTGTVVPAAGQDPWTERLTSTGLVAARTHGCACPESLPGGLILLDARRAPAGSVSSTAVVHQLFTDGVTTASLFSLQGDLGPDDAAGLQQRGFRREQLGDHYAWVREASSKDPAVTVVWACRGSVLTLVADDALDPLQTAGAVLAALPPEPDPQDTSLWSRIARGWHRITGGGS